MFVLCVDVCGCVWMCICGCARVATVNTQEGLCMTNTSGLGDMRTGNEHKMNTWGFVHVHVQVDTGG